MNSHPAARFTLFVASSRGEDGKGIVRFTLNATDGSFERGPILREGVESPLYLATDPYRQRLYVADCPPASAGTAGGALTAHAIESGSGSLHFLNRRSSEGSVPCYLTVSADRRFVLVANYGDGSVASIRLGADGRLGDTADVRAHRPEPGEPLRPAHAHSILLDAANQFAYAGELGLDQVRVYRFDPAQGTLTPCRTWNARRGAGPRHFVFHPTLPYAYLINELDSTLVAFARDGTAGTLSELQTLSTLPPGFAGTNYCADLHVHPNGRFLYGSNRGHDSLVICAIDPTSGRLSLLGHEPTRGHFPRSFAFDPTGRFVVVGNEKSDTLVSFRVNADTGTLTPTGHTAAVSAPSALCFLQPPSP